MRVRTVVVLVVLAVVAGVGVATYRGQVAVPMLSGCTATVEGQRVRVSLEQAQNASLIAAIGVRRGLPARAVSIALATAYQESKIVNIDYGDRDSLGLFQQRPSQGWGSQAEVQDEFYATNAFYDALVQVEGYQRMRITEAAQTVQRSGFPEAYEDHAADARVLASALTGYSAGGRFSCTTGGVDDADPDGFADLLVRAYGDPALTRSDGLVVSVGGGDAGTRQGWSVAQFAVAWAQAYGISSVSFADRRWESGRPSRDGWVTTDDPTPPGAVEVRWD